MGYADDWKKAKTKFEKETNQQKPDKKMALVIKVHTGLAGACKALDAAIDGEAAVAAETAMKDLSKAIAGYVPTARSAAAKAGPVYKAAIDKLLKALTKIETSAIRAVNVVAAAASQDSGGSSYNPNFGSIPGTGGSFSTTIAAFHKTAAKANLPVKELKGVAAYVATFAKYEKTRTKLRAARGPVLKSIESGGAKSEALVAAYENLQFKADGIRQTLIKIGRPYPKIVGGWSRELFLAEKKDSSLKELKKLAQLFSSTLAQAENGLTMADDLLEPLPQAQGGGGGFNENFGSLPHVTDNTPAAWATLVKCAEKAGLPVADLKGASSFGQLLGKWAPLSKNVANAYAQLQKAKPADREKLIAEHAKAAAPLEQVVKALRARLDEYDRVASKWGQLIPRGMKVGDIPMRFAQWNGCARTKLIKSLRMADLKKMAVAEYVAADTDSDDYQDDGGVPSKKAAPKGTPDYQDEGGIPPKTSQTAAKPSKEEEVEYSAT